MTYLCLEHFVIDDEQFPDRNTNLQHHSVDKVHSPVSLTGVLLQQLNYEFQWEKALTARVRDT